MTIYPNNVWYDATYVAATVSGVDRGPAILLWPEGPDKLGVWPASEYSNMVSIRLCCV